MEKNSREKINSDNAVEEIKSRLDIIDTVSEHVVLKKSGRNYWGLCPFHKEKTPSFSVNPEKGIFKCFGCGAGGDSLSFMMKVNNASFWETIVMLAQKFGIELPQAGVSREKTEIKKQITDLNKKAVDYYEKTLLESQEASQAREYLSKRGISKEIIEKFHLGFAPNSFDSLIKHLKEKNEVLLNAGLVSEKSSGSGYIDRFRNRIMIPIQNEKGEFIAFGARAVLDSQQPKYLNSPDTPVFNKSRSLFAVHQAKDAIKEQDSVILMEGYFDVITAHAHGLTNVVATLGTALTEQHVRIISKYSDSRKIYLAFDADDAGITATNRGAEVIKSVFSSLGEVRHFDESFTDFSINKDRTACEIRVIATNTGKDPDEFLRGEGVDAYKNLVEKAPLLIDYQINRLIGMKDNAVSPQEKAGLSREIIPLLSEINNSIIRNEYVRLVAEKLGVDEESLNIEVRKNLQKVTLTEEKKGYVLQAQNKDSRCILVQKNLLGLYFLNNEKITPLCINDYLKDVNFPDPELKLIKGSIDRLIEEISDPDELFRELLTELSENEDAKAKLTDLIYSLEDKKYLSFELIDQYIKDHINYLKTYEMTEIHKKLRNDYYENNKDDVSSARHQQKVREFIRQKRSGLKVVTE